MTPTSTAASPATTVAPTSTAAPPATTAAPPVEPWFEISNAGLDDDVSHLAALFRATPPRPTPARAPVPRPAPALATPARATPARATPARATPARATPARATPACATPVHTTRATRRRTLPIINLDEGQEEDDVSEDDEVMLPTVDDILRPSRALPPPLPAPVPALPPFFRA